MAKGYPDFEGDKSGLYLKPEWAAKEGTDKTFQAYGANKPSVGSVSATYEVTAGKTLYITQVSAYIVGNLAEDRDNNQICFVQIWDETEGVLRWTQGGNGGFGTVLSIPLVFKAAVALSMALYNYSNHNCDIRIVVSGYEI